MTMGLEGQFVGPLALTGNHVTIGELLGSGSEAETYACTMHKHDNTDEELAASAVNLKKFHGSAEALKKKLDKLEKHVSIAQKIKNKHCLELRDVFRTSSVLMLVTEKQQGDLLNTIYTIRGGRRFTEEEVKYMFPQFLDGLNAMHAQGIIHRDLKLDNILVSSQKVTGNVTLCEIKICDYGWAKDLSGGAQARTRAGTASYCAPEVICDSGEPYGFGADFWSLGVMLYVLLWGSLPFKRNQRREIVSYELQFPDENASESTTIVSAEAKDLLGKLLQFHPACRADMHVCRTHPWLTGERLQPEAASSSSAAKLSPSPSFANGCSFEFGQNTFTSSATMPSISQNPDKGNMVEIYSNTAGDWLPAEVTKVTVVEIECTTNCGKMKTIQLPSSEEVRFTTNGGRNGATQEDPVILWQALRIKELEEQLEQAKKTQQPLEKKELSLETESSQRKRKLEAIEPLVHTEDRSAASDNSSAEEDASLGLALTQSLMDAEEDEAMQFALTQSLQHTGVSFAMASLTAK